MPAKTLITVVGPTAIGKTALAIKLAQYYATEIISSDSRQFFKEMKIGTAVPTEEELISAQHHFIHHKSVEDQYSVGAFERDAVTLLHELFKTKNIVIMVGGSGLYVDAVLNGLDDFPDIDPKIREQLNLQLATKGLTDLQEQLKIMDPETYEKIDRDNPHRVIRALEICIGTDKTYSSFLKKQTLDRSFASIVIGLTAERSTIYERINKRVDIMMEQGLLEEAKSLLDKKNLNALNTVGYKEIFNYLNGEWTLEFAVSEIKKNTRRFAKRQLTWFRKKEGIIWVNYNEEFSKTTNIIDALLVK